mmetsp:Transcript_35473/g.82857  ORF Transcript_35473/g.82857 Transcript_35473/m.82857 type:complete len:177 (-) Transcript_35473:289-819(-)|eukprot:CAMPEP_0119380264 /NCGR_PEP_ID=MMETSP1334-20130426/56180_1 /TAXON_ID=127549 /ORGANISM="Calcidiscus leptoporus, Strain RCC1130" /LENGTH=176 /DNA_ID=CAMNT_0007400017 /DNA_START=170 /DNA_END=700 /DNA_ORIENTATION=+
MEVPEVVQWGNALGDGGTDTECQHGPVECTVMRTYACSKYKYSPSALTHLKFLHCFDDTLIQTFPAGLPPGTVNATYAATVFKQCATTLSLDAAALSACAAGDEGTKLFAQEKAKTPSHMGVPFVTINEGAILYNNAELNLHASVCKAYTGTRPLACTEFLKQVSPFAYTSFLSIA